MTELRPVLNMNNVLVVIPAFNEAKSVGQVIKDVLATGFQVLVVDDCSTDDTALIAKKNGASVLQLSINLGVGGALRAGFKYADSQKFQAVIQIDADGQHPVDQSKDLLFCINAEKAHLVVGSRFLSGNSIMEISKIRRFTMMLLASSASVATRTRVTDPTSGFRVIGQPLLHEFSKTFPANYLSDTYEALVIAGRFKYKVREIPADIKDRLHGVSSASFVNAFLFTIKVFTTSLLHMHPRISRCLEN